jgi:hypothetical protein
MELVVDEKHAGTDDERWATDAFTSQITPRHSELEHGPVLTDTVLQRFRRPFEVFIETDG